MNDIDKVVVVTGASTGIGAATARQLAARGATLVLGSRHQGRLSALAADLRREHGADVTCLATDVRRRAAVAALVDAAVSTHGRIDVMLSNAGVMPVSPLDDLRVDDWDEMIDTNLRGFLHGIAAALPVFRAQAAGHFVTVSSSSGLQVRPNMAVYAGTKFAVRAVSEGLRQEAGPHLRVTVVSPGFTATDGVGRGVGNAGLKAGLLRSRDEFAMPPEAVAGAIVFAIDQPAHVDVNEIVVRPTAQP